MLTEINSSPCVPTGSMDTFEKFACVLCGGNGQWCLGGACPLCDGDGHFRNDDSDTMGLSAIDAQTHVNNLWKTNKDLLEVDDCQEFDAVIHDWLADPDFKLEIRSFFGATVEMPLLRLESYLLAPLRLLRSLIALKGELSKLGHRVSTPLLTLGSAHALGVKVNGDEMSVAVVEKTSIEIMKRVQKFLQSFFTDVQDQVTIVSDTPGTWNHPVVEKYLQWGSAYIAELDDGVATQFRQMGFKHGGEAGAQRALTYAAAHALLFSDVAYSKHLTNTFKTFHGHAWEPSIDVCPGSANGLITIGGSPERLFNVGRRLLSCDRNCADIMTSLAHEVEGPQSDMVAGTSQFVARLISVAGHEPVYYRSVSQASKQPYEGDLSYEDAMGMADKVLVHSLIMSKNSKYAKRDFQLLRHFYLDHTARSNGFHSSEELCYGLLINLTKPDDDRLTLDPHFLVRLDSAQKVLDMSGLSRFAAGGTKNSFSKKKSLWNQVSNDNLWAVEWNTLWTAIKHKAPIPPKEMVAFESLVQDSLFLRHHLSFIKDSSAIP